MTESIGETV